MKHYLLPSAEELNGRRLSDELQIVLDKTVVGGIYNSNVYYANDKCHDNGKATNSSAQLRVV